MYDCFLANVVKVSKYDRVLFLFFGICLLLFELLHLFCMHVHWIFIEYIGHIAAQVLCLFSLLERFTCIGTRKWNATRRSVALCIL